MHRDRWSQTNGWVLWHHSVDRPSSPTVVIYTRSAPIFILCGAMFLATWTATSADKV